MRQELEQRFEAESKALAVIREHFQAKVVRWTFLNGGSVVLAGLAERRFGLQRASWT
jgi:hypothetical protein